MFVRLPSIEVVLDAKLDPLNLSNSDTGLGKADRCWPWSASCAFKIAPACCKSVCCNKERCNIASDADFFFRIGFLSGYAPGVSRLLGGGDEFEAITVSFPGWYVLSGPYNHVTSQSFSL